MTVLPFRLAEGWRAQWQSRIASMWGTLVARLASRNLHGSVSPRRVEIDAP